MQPGDKTGPEVGEPITANFSEANESPAVITVDVLDLKENISVIKSP